MLPVLGCLAQAEKELGSDGPWMTVNPIQQRFLDQCYGAVRSELARIPELESIAAKSAAEINAFLKARGFDIQLQDFSSGKFAVASVFNLLLKWIEKGEVATIRDGSYPAVRMKRHITICASPAAPKPIATISTQSGDVVHLTILDDAPSGFDLLGRIDDIGRSLTPVRGYGSLVFPMISCDQMVDIGWIVGMMVKSADGMTWDIEEALQQTKFRMNEEGAHVQSAAAMTMRSMSFEQKKEELVIDRPFVLWIRRPGMDQPFFAGYFSEDSWKKPESL